MEKIVILNGTSEEDNMLFDCLRILFPECEIQIRSGNNDSSRDVSINQENSHKRDGWKKDGENLDY